MTRRFSALARAAALAGAFLAACGTASAQTQVNPVYVDDSPIAADTFSRVGDHLAGGNLDEAARVLQGLLDQQPDRLITADDRDLFVSVRAGVHRLLLSTPTLLARYRAIHSPAAAAALENEADPARVERAYLLTASGFEAALRVAQAQLEDARFEAARITLGQLDGHPDRAGELAADGAAICAQIVRYLDRPAVRAELAAWRRAAGLDDARPVEAGTWPEGARSRGMSVTEPLPPLDTSGVIAQPLWTVSLTTTPTQADGPGLDRRGAGGVGAGAAVPPFARELSILPTVADDLVFINDGVQISALDRFTLAPRWTASPEVVAAANEDEGRGAANRAFRERGGYNYGAASADASTVSVVGRYAAAATGRSPGAGRNGDTRIHGIDARSGKIRWSVGVAGLDPSLADSSVRGPVAISEGLVVAAARKYVPDRRLVSLTLIGLDAASGQTRWVRPVGSAGWLPFVNQASGPEGMAVVEGIAYRADRLGVVGAVEVATGRPLWVRRMPTDAGTGTEPPAPWEVSTPVIDGPSLIVIAADGRRLVRLDRATGKVLGAREAEAFGPAVGYLLGVGDRLAVVSSDRVSFAPIASFETAAVVQSPLVLPPGVRGRVSVVGDRLVVPTATGFTVIDPTDPHGAAGGGGGGAPSVALDEPGNVLALGSQLIVVDDSRVHSYLKWEVAEALLNERMTSDPRDPAPAVTFAELAYRAGRTDRILAAVDHAIDALAQPGAAGERTSARARLLDTLHGMINASLEGGATAGSLPGEARGVGGASGGGPAIADRALVATLVDRLRTLATEPDQRITVALAAGRLAEADNNAIAAVAAYQTVLDDASLAAATWQGPLLTVRGDLEATRRIETLIAANGPAVYAAQEQQAGSALAALGPAPSADSLEPLTARFPVASVAPEIWSLLASAHATAGRERAALGALEAGLRAAQRVSAPSAPAVGEIAGRLVLALRARQQVVQAAGVLRAVRERFPGLPLTSAGQPIDVAGIEADLAERVAATLRWPRIGPVRAEGVQPLVGWSLLEPILREPYPHVRTFLTMESAEEVALFGSRSADPAAPAPLAPLWSRPLGTDEVTLLKQTAEAAYLMLAGDDGVVVERIPALPAGKAWATPPMAKVFPPDESSRGMKRAPGVMADRFVTPTDGLVSPTETIVSMDERTLVIVQRSGRAAGFDTDTGELLWTAVTPVTRVYDAELAYGTLVLGGDGEVTGAGGEVVDLRPTIEVLDARTGRSTQRLGDKGGHVRWVKLADASTLICGLESAVVCTDLGTAQTHWKLNNDEMIPTVAAWLFGDRLVMLAPDRTLWLASASTGQMNPQPLDAPRSHLDAARTVEAFPTTPSFDSPFAFATHLGLLVYAPDGRLRGVDGLGALDTMLPPKPAEDRAVTIETVADGKGADGLMAFSLHALGSADGILTDSRQILLGARPSALALLDGRIAVTAGGVTLVLLAPAAAE